MRLKSQKNAQNQKRNAVKTRLAPFDSIAGATRFIPIVLHVDLKHVVFKHSR